MATRQACRSCNRLLESFRTAKLSFVECPGCGQVGRPVQVEGPEEEPDVADVVSAAPPPPKTADPRRREAPAMWLGVLVGAVGVPLAAVYGGSVGLQLANACIGTLIGGLFGAFWGVMVMLRYGFWPWEVISAMTVPTHRSALLFWGRLAAGVGFLLGGTIGAILTHDAKTPREAAAVAGAVAGGLLFGLVFAVGGRMMGEMARADEDYAKRRQGVRN